MENRLKLLALLLLASSAAALPNGSKKTQKELIFWENVRLCEKMSLGVISMSDQEVESHIRRLMEEHMDKAQTKRENPLLERDSDNDDVVSEKPSFLRQITANILYFFYSSPP